MEPAYVVQGVDGVRPEALLLSWLSPGWLDD